MDLYYANICADWVEGTSGVGAVEEKQQGEEQLSTLATILHPVYSFGKQICHTHKFQKPLFPWLATTLATEQVQD